MVIPRGAGNNLDLNKKYMAKGEHRDKNNKKTKKPKQVKK